MAQLLVRTCGTNRGGAQGWNVQPTSGRPKDFIQHINHVQVGSQASWHHQSGRTTSSLHGACLGWSAQWAALAGVVSFWRRRGRRPLRCVRERVRRCGRVRGVDAEFESIYNALNKEATVGNTREAEKLFKQLEDIGLPTAPSRQRMVYNTLLKAYANKGDKQKAQQLTEKMAELGIEPNVKGTGKLLEAAVKSGDVVLAQKLFEQPDVAPGTSKEAMVSWNLMMDVHAKHGDWEQALFTLQSMRETRIRPDSKSYSTCMNACGKSGHPARANALLNEMRNVALAPSLTEYTAVMTAYRDNIKQVEQTFEAMIADSIEPDLAAYTSVVSSCAKAARKSGSVKLAYKAIEYVRKMKSNLVEPNDRTYTSLIDTLASTHCIDGPNGAKSLLLRKTDMEGFKLGVPAWTAILFAYKTRGELNEAKEWWKVMESRMPQELDMQAYTCMLGCYADAGDVDGALGIFESMQQANVAVDAIVHNTIMKAFVRGMDVDGAFAWLQTMPDRGIKPTPLNYHVVLSAATTTPEMAEAILRLMVGDGVSPDPRSEESLRRKLGNRYDDIAAELGVKVKKYNRHLVQNAGYMKRRRRNSLDRDSTKLRSKL